VGFLDKAKNHGLTKNLQNVVGNITHGVASVQTAEDFGIGAVMKDFGDIDAELSLPELVLQGEIII